MEISQKIQEIVGYSKINKSQVLQLLELGGTLEIRYGVYKSVYIEFADGTTFWRLRKGVENQVNDMCQKTLHGKEGYSLKIK